MQSSHTLKDSIYKNKHIRGLLCITLLCILTFLPVGAFENASTTVPLHILAVNDFHGQIASGETMNGSPVGSIPVLGAYLQEKIAEYGENYTIIALPGDFSGASPVESNLLLDEPAILFFNSFVTGDWKKTTVRNTSDIRVVATIGNHEFDRNITELLRLINGGNGDTTIYHPVDPYPGALWPVVVSNAYLKESGKLLFEPYVIRMVNDIPVAFIGAVTTETAEISLPVNVDDVIFTDEADAINENIKKLQKQGIHSFVILVHEGGTQTPYSGQTQESGDLSGRITSIVMRLDEDADVVISAHSHEFTNQFLPNAGGKPTLVTQAYSYSSAFADINLTLDRSLRDITEKTAVIIPTYAGEGPGLVPDQNAQELLDTINASIQPLISDVIGTTDIPITRELSDNGESLLYDIAADSMRWSMKTDMAVINLQALRADIPAGEITTGMAYSVMPFHDQLFSVQLTGQQIKDLLHQQWNRTVKPDNLLQISGFSYSYDASRNPADRVTSISMNGTEIDMNANYSVATTNYLATGGDGYSVMEEGIITGYGMMDVDAFISYLESLPMPVETRTGGRITVTNSSYVHE